MNISLSLFAPENFVSRDGFGRPVPAESGSYSRDPSRFPRRRLFIYLNATGSVPSYRDTQFLTDGAHCRESADTGPVVLKVVPVTGAVFSQVTTNQLICASLFPRSGHIERYLKLIHAALFEARTVDPPP